MQNVVSRTVPWRSWDVWEAKFLDLVFWPRIAWPAYEQKAQRHSESLASVSVSELQRPAADWWRGRAWKVGHKPAIITKNTFQSWELWWSVLQVFSREQTISFLAVIPTAVQQQRSINHSKRGRSEFHTLPTERPVTQSARSVLNIALYLSIKLITKTFTTYILMFAYTGHTFSLSSFQISCL